MAAQRLQRVVGTGLVRCSGATCVQPSALYSRVRADLPLSPSVSQKVSKANHNCTMEDMQANLKMMLS